MSQDISETFCKCEDFNRSSSRPSKLATSKTCFYSNPPTHNFLLVPWAWFTRGEKSKDPFLHSRGCFLRLQRTVSRFQLVTEASEGFFPCGSRTFTISIIENPAIADFPVELPLLSIIGGDKHSSRLCGQQFFKQASLRCKIPIKWWHTTWWPSNFPLPFNLSSWQEAWSLKLKIKL